MTQPIIIIGGGMAGLTCAWYLSKLNQEVMIFDENEAGSQASTAAAGMLSPAFEATYTEEAYLNLFLQSLGIYDDFITEVEKVSGLPTDYQKKGALLLAVDQDDEGELNRYFEFQQQLGLPVKRVSTNEILELEPLITPQICCGVLAPQERAVDTMKLIPALKEALIKRGVKIIEHKKVTVVKISHNAIEGIEVDSQSMKASQIILATGSGTPLDGLPAGLIPEIRPVKGQALELKIEQAGFPLNRIVKTFHKYPVYCVPRCDGRLTVGATSEEKGFDRKLTTGAIMELLSGLWRILPSCEHMEFVGAWYGFRPATKNNAPVFGPTKIDGLHLALGYFRHGILLSPLIGNLLAESIVNQKHHPLMDQFGVQS